MNDIDKMPSKCQGCTYWEVCEYPYICDDIKPKQAENGNLNAEFAKNPQDRPTDGLIRKQDAIAAVNDVLAEYIPTFMPWQERIPLDCALKIKALPPVYVPEINVGDMISRQTAIDIVEFECGEWSGLARTIVKAIKELPPVQPDIIRCRNCKFASGDSRICMQFGHSPIGELDFCAWAKRRTDE